MEYSLQAAVPVIFESTGLGAGEMLSTPTFNVMQAFGLTMGRAFSGQYALLQPKSHNNSELYGKVGQLLG
jgi:hypothetical protein